MRKPVQIIGTSLGAAAIIGVTGAAASAQGGYDDHGGYDGHSYGSDHHGYGGDHHGYGSHDWGNDDDQGYGDPSYSHSDYSHSDSEHHSWSDNGWSDTDSGAHHHWWGSHAYAHHGPVSGFGDNNAGSDGTSDSTPDRHGFGSPGDHTATFDQRKAAVVSALQAADARLTSLQDRLSATAANDPSGFAPKALTWVTQARAHVESLLSQVQAATTDQQLAQILQQAPSAWSAAAPAG